MTRDEVARECERHGWKLEEQELYVNDHAGHRRETLYTILTPLGEGRQRAVATQNDAYAAYLEACRREQVTPF